MEKLESQNLISDEQYQVLGGSSPKANKSHRILKVMEKMIRLGSCDSPSETPGLFMRAKGMPSR